MNDLTDAIYWASKDQRIVALGDVEGDANRFMAASALNDLGLIIDMTIDIWRWEPTKVMADRKGNGLTWTANAFDPQPYDAARTIHPRAIPVSTDAADYPPMNPPKPVVAVPTSPVGSLIGNGIYAVDGSCWDKDAGHWAYTEGQSAVAPDSVTVYWHLGYNIMFRAPMWETAQARDARIGAK